MHTGAVRTSDLGSLIGGEDDVAIVVGVGMLSFLGDFFSDDFLVFKFFRFVAFFESFFEELEAVSCREIATARVKSSSSVE